MAGFTGGRLVAVAAAGASALALAACSGMTYGTGTPPGLQTVKDVAGLSSLSGEKRDPIDYEPRPAVVVPPETAGLPPPSNGDTAVAANWPVDPDERYEQFRRDVAALEAEGKSLDFELPTGATPGEDPYADLTPAQRKALIERLAKQARSSVAVDEYGNPVRRFLSDPPVEYREGDPEAPAPLAEDEQQKKKKWWQFWRASS